MRLTFWRRDNSERIKALREQLRETAQKLGRANALVNQHEASIRAFNKAVQDWQRELALEQKLSAEYLRERDEARRQVAELASEAVIATDRVRVLETALSDAREQLRRVERDLALERNAGEVVITAEGLGAAMDRMRQLRLPGQRDGEVGA